MKRTVLAVLVAAVLGMVGCATVLLYVRGADARAVANTKAVRVLVATKRIPAGTSGAEVKGGGYVELVMMPKISVPKDALGAIDSSMDSLVLNADLQPRQLLLSGAFGTAVTTSNGLRIPEGKIAVTVPVVTTAGTTFLQAGSKVAVFDTFTALEGKNGVPAGDGLSRDHLFNQQTRVLLPSIEVLATADGGQVISANGATEKSAADVASSTLGDKAAASNSAVMLVTVAASQDEAERLIHASQTGTLYIALLDGTTTVQPGPGVDNNTLFN